MTWTGRIGPIEGGRGVRVALDVDGRPASLADLLDGWQGDAACRAAWDDLLAGVPFEAYRWETPPATAATLARPFECVLLDDPGLERPADPAAFAEHFRGPADAGAATATFANLGGDAVLVVPRPGGDPAACGHLAAFVRLAPEVQRHAFWRAVGAAMAARVGPRPVWLSTAGAGVPWLHARLDDRPKYYGHAPYRRPA